jgi:hypothetical protein
MGEKGKDVTNDRRVYTGPVRARLFCMPSVITFTSRNCRCCDVTSVGEKRLAVQVRSVAHGQSRMSASI